MNRRLVGLALSLALVAGSAAPAAACGMYEGPSVESAMDRIASAKSLLEQNRLEDAAAYARSAAKDRRASKSVRAEAYSLAGLIRWKQGNTRSAKINFQKARELDAAQYENVVAKQTDADSIRKAVEEV